jgi:hypothetical protein
VYNLIQRGELETVRLCERKSGIRESILNNYCDEVQDRADRYPAAPNRIAPA